MTDFDTDMMREDKPPLPLAAEKDPLREPPRVLASDPTLIAALAALSRDGAAVPRPEAEPERAAAAHDRQPPAPAAGPEAVADAARQAEEARLRTGPRAGAGGPEADPVADEMRARQVTRALAALLQAPEGAHLTPLLVSHQAVTRDEAGQVADAVLALYLRAGAEMRRRMRPALSGAVAEAPGGALARALSARLGALVMASRPVAPPSDREDRDGP